MSNDLENKTEEEAKSFWDKTKETLSNLKDKAEDLAEQAGDEASKVWDKTKDAAANAYETAKDKVQDVINKNDEEKTA